MSDRTLTTVHCAGCRRPLALAASVVGRLFCDEFCAEDHPVSAHESRDALIAASVAKGLPKPELADLYGVTRQRIDQIAALRLKAASTN